jgi:putative tryptophan/tyrosine transport system substrate-binding protein
MRRRQFIAGLGSAAAWPVVARAQQGERIRRIGVLMAFEENDPQGKSYLSAFMQGLGELGWTDARNVRVEIRWAADNLDRLRMFAKELIELQPDVLYTSSTPATSALHRETRTIPIVFASVSDPIGAGFVTSLPHPGGNITGFINLEGTLGGKWLELLTEIAPGIKRAAILFNPDTAPSDASDYLRSFEAAARSLKMEPIAAPVHSDAEIEMAITSLGREPGGGLVVMADVFTRVHRAPIIMAAARNNVPAAYWQSVFVTDGGLLSYGPDYADIFRRAAAYVHRVLRGEKPADLPVQFPVKFEITLNAKTAKTLGLTIPETLLATADEVIQ